MLPAVAIYRQVREATLVTTQYAWVGTERLAGSDELALWEIRVAPLAPQE